MIGKKSKRNKINQPVLIAIIVAIIGVIGTVITTLINSRTQIELKTIELTQESKSATQAAQGVHSPTIMPSTETDLPITNIATPTIAIESSICTTDNSIGWEFDVNGNTEEWKNHRSLRNTMAQNGVLSADIFGTDPYWDGPTDLAINTSLYVILEIRYRIIADDDTAQLMWATKDHPSNLWIEYQIISDGGWHTIIINLPEESIAWSGTVTRLRLDPVKDAQSGTVEIDYIRLCSSTT